MGKASEAVTERRAVDHRLPCILSFHTILRTVLSAVNSCWLEACFSKSILERLSKSLDINVMDDLADVFNTENVREGPAFKKPVLIGKRPGMKVVQSQSLSKTSDENCIVTESKTEKNDDVNNQVTDTTVGKVKTIHSTPVPSGNANPLNYSIPNWLVFLNFIII